MAPVASLATLEQLGFDRVWIGTEDGLNRYDGYTFTVYRHDPDDPGSLSNDFVSVIYRDRSDVLWIGRLPDYATT